jgi:hypothetical protein
MKIDSDRPAANAENELTANGLNQPMSNGWSRSPAADRLDDRGDGEEHQHEHLEAHEHVLQLLGGLHVAVRDEGRASMNSRHTPMLMTVFDARSAISALPVICEISRNRKSTATPARFDSTRIVATTRPQPAIQPTHGPNARVAQVKGARIRHAVVQLAVAEGDQQHRDEADEDDRRDLRPTRMPWGRRPP